MRISDWSSDVCSSDLRPGCARPAENGNPPAPQRTEIPWPCGLPALARRRPGRGRCAASYPPWFCPQARPKRTSGDTSCPRFPATGQSAWSYASLPDAAWRRSSVNIRRKRSPDEDRSEEHTSELQSLMRISYAVFCLKKKRVIINKIEKKHTSNQTHHK